MDELKSSSISLIKRSSINAPTPTNQAMIISDFDDISSQQISVQEINQRPIKDPRQLALLNIENKSTLSKNPPQNFNDFEPDMSHGAMVRDALLEKMNLGGARQMSMGNLKSRASMKTSKSTSGLNDLRNMQLKHQLSNIMKQKKEISYKNPFLKPPTKKKVPSHNQLVIL